MEPLSIFLFLLLLGVLAYELSQSGTKSPDELDNVLNSL